MSLIPNAVPAAASPALAPMTSIVRHGHKRTSGSALGTDASSGSSPSSTQDLFSTLLQSVEQVIGVSTAADPAAAASAQKGAAAAAAMAARINQTTGLATRANSTGSSAATSAATGGRVNVNA